MSAEIIPFLPRTRRQHDPRDISHLFRTRTQADDLVMDHVDSAPREVLAAGEPDDAG